MKAKELMIGDWVLFGEKPVRVLQLSEGKDYKYINPIPLTPEILEKNSDGGFFYHDSPIIGYNGKRSTCHIGRASLYVELTRTSFFRMNFVRLCTSFVRIHFDPN